MSKPNTIFALSHHRNKLFRQFKISCKDKLQDASFFSTQLEDGKKQRVDQPVMDMEEKSLVVVSVTGQVPLMKMLMNACKGQS